MVIWHDSIFKWLIGWCDVCDCYSKLFYVILAVDGWESPLWKINGPLVMRSWCGRCVWCLEMISVDLGWIWWSFDRKWKRTKSWNLWFHVYPVYLVTQDVDRAHSELTHSWELKFLTGYRIQCTRSGHTEDPLKCQMFVEMPVVHPVDRMTLQVDQGHYRLYCLTPS